MSDFDLDKAKEFLKDPMRHSEKNIEWVEYYLNGSIAEIERLQSENIDEHVRNINKETTQRAEYDIKIKSLTEDADLSLQRIEDLTRERDELKKKIPFYSSENFEKRKEVLYDKIEKLEAENAELVSKNIKNLEDKLVLKDKLAASEKARLEAENPSIEVKSIQCDRCGEVLINIPKLQIYHKCNDPAQGSGRL